jgi:hypothetical protein
MAQHGHLSISELAGFDAHGLPRFPAVSVQSLEIGGVAPKVSAPFHDGTRAVRLVSDVACRIAIASGDAEPVACEFDTLLPANSPEVFAVEKGRIAVIALEGAAMQTSDPLAFLKVIQDPAAAQARLQEITARDSAVTEKEAALRALSAQAEADRQTAEAAHAEREQALSEAESRHAARVGTIDKREAALRKQEEQARAAADQLAALKAEIADKEILLDRLKTDLAAIRQKVAA